MLGRHVFVGLVRLKDRPRPADRRRQPVELAPDPGLGAVGHQPRFVVPGQPQQQVARGVLGARQKRRAFARAGHDDVGTGMARAHRRQQRLLGPSGDAVHDQVGVAVLDQAHLKAKPRLSGDHVHRRARVDFADVAGGPGRLVRVRGIAFRRLLGGIGQCHGDPCRRHARVHAKIGAASVPFEPGDLEDVFVAALVALDHGHVGRLADDRQIGPDAARLQMFDQRTRAIKPDLLVIGQRDVNRRLRLGEGPRLGQDAGDEALHVAGAAPVKPTVALGQRPGIARPVLPLDRDHVDMSRQDHAAVALGPEAGPEVRLLPGRVQLRLAARARRLQHVAAIGDAVEVAVGRNRGKRHEPFKMFAQAGHARQRPRRCRHVKRD